MNIYAKEGDKVTVTEESINNGYKPDKEQANRLLNVGYIYTVDHTNVGGWSTSVRLKEFPEQYFNSAHFEDCDDEDEVSELVKKDGKSFLESKGITEKTLVFGPAVFKVIVCLLDEYIVYFNNN